VIPIRSGYFKTLKESPSFMKELDKRPGSCKQIFDLFSKRKIENSHYIIIEYLIFFRPMVIDRNWVFDLFHDDDYQF
jgi:hypothetical protein